MQALPDRFAPAAIEAFHYVGFEWDEGTATASLRYALDDFALTERITFPSDPALTGPAAAAFERTLRLLWLAAGASYFKAAAPSHAVVDTEPVTTGEAAFVDALLLHGLAEFRYVNGLDPHISPRLSHRRKQPAPVTGLGLDAGRPLVAIGGGKDSCVALQGLVDHGASPITACVKAAPIIDRVMERAGLPAVRIGRALDPTLFELNRRGALNGHVPITAIVSLTLVLQAIRSGAGSVVMSIERSASEATLAHEGFDVNHQWSKSIEAERMLSELLATHVAPTDELAWFSLLRPFSELGITRLFAQRCGHFDDVFSSCNKAFRMDPATRVDGWCGDCPKCRFVGLALAPWTGRDRLIAIQDGHDVLDDLAQADGLAAIVEVGGPKPFECVGEVAESRVAVRMLADDAQWAASRALQTVAARLRDADGWASDADVARTLEADAPTTVPARWHPVVADLAAVVGADLP